MNDDKRLERIEAKLDDSNDHLAKIDLTLTAQHITLAEHIRRTGLLEKDLAPIKRHVNMIQGAGAFIAILSLIAGIIALFKK